MEFGRTHRFVIAFALVANCSSILAIESSIAQDAESRPAGSPTYAVDVLSALRRDDLAGALEHLGKAADASPGVLAAGDQGLAAAAAAVHRALMQLGSEERYEHLSAWSLPTNTRPAVRVLSTLTPQDAPPQVFARVLGERPRESSFPVAEISGLRGLFSTGWMFVQAADESGRLRPLIAELEQLALDGVPNADGLLLLARIADRRSDEAKIAGQLRRREATLQVRLQTDSKSTIAIDPTDLVVAAAALQRAPLRPTSEAITKLLLDSTDRKSLPRVRAYLRVAHATAALIHRGAAGAEALHTQRLKYWLPVSGMTAEAHARGGVHALWIAHEDHLLHLAGSGEDALLLRFPLTGRFEFSCETQEGGDTNGGLIYGGLHFEALGAPEQLTVWDVNRVPLARKPCPYVRHESYPTFHQVSLRSAEASASFAVNMHPMWVDGDAASTSPWLGLRSPGDCRPVYRNLRITGQPVIPREVHLTRGDQMRGWQTGFFGASLTAASDDVSHGQGETQPPHSDWRMDDGVLHAVKRQLPQAEFVQSMLQYQRPLLESESIQYEFYYEPGAYEVHPALGRFAFLLHPDGVRIHWVTDGTIEWTSLPENNETLEPLHRRGPRPLPLRAKAWNRIKLTRTKNKVLLALNDQPIYERPLDWTGDLRFGLYRNAAATAARVRDVVMTGDWPETVPEDFRANPAVLANEPLESADRRVHGELIGAGILAENLRRVRRQAARLEPEARFAHLAEWVLPSADHPDFRVVGEFTPTDPSLLARQLDSELFAAGDRGGGIVSPAFDLVDAAAATGRLDELRTLVADASSPDDEAQHRARAALLVLVNLALDDSEAANQAAERLRLLALAATPVHENEMWPELLVLERGFQDITRVPSIGELLSSLFAQRTSRSVPSNCENWHTRLAAFMERYRGNLASQGTVGAPPAAELDDWIPVLRLSARSRGVGYAQARWQRDALNEVRHVTGHHEDYLFFRSPLRGDFDVTGEIGLEATTQLFVAGKYFGPRWAQAELETGTFRAGSKIGTIDPPFAQMRNWVRFRANVREGMRTIWINGREVHRESLPEHHDPWVGIRAWSRAVARMRNVQVSGRPDIPESVLMSASPELIGWVPYYDESAGDPAAVWQHVGAADESGEIRGLRRAELDGTHCESMLGYHRPLVENGAIEYEFYYEPDKTIAHPALDRLVFLMTLQGVRLHWLTDDKYDRTTVPPDNAFDEPGDRRGPASLQLRPQDWNHVRLAIEGNMVHLSLNGQEVYAREIEKANRRTFGLFHYADKTELRVRNVTMKGEWPKELGPPAKQDLMDPAVVALDEALPKLTSVFAHDFAEQGVPEQFFRTFNSDRRGEVRAQPEGAHILRPGAGNWTSVVLSLPFSTDGDFDFEASFEQLHLAGEQHSCILLQASLDDPVQHHCRLVRIRHAGDHQEIDASLSLLRPDGERSFINKPLTSEALSGTLRVARRGNVVHYLFAEGESRAFQLVGADVVSDAPLKHEGVELSALCNGAGDTQVLWKQVTLRAEQLYYWPPQAEPRPQYLHLVNADGSNVQVLTGPAPGFNHLGSPEWSADGNKIVLDMSRGSVDTSHLFVIDADGANLRDLGPGCMPSLSADGQRVVASNPGEGIVTINADGSNRKVVDAAGWGAQWSPDGKYIAYGMSGNIVLMNPDTRKQRRLLAGEHATRYSMIYWNFGWSHDSQWIAFKAMNRTTGEFELAAANTVSPEKFIVLYTTKGSLNEDVSWAPDNRKVLLTIAMPDKPGFQMFWIDRTNPQAPQLFSGQPADRVAFNCDWSPDGRQIAFSGDVVPQPIAWPMKNAGVKAGAVTPATRGASERSSGTKP